jgi:hypothetical protein
MKENPELMKLKQWACIVKMIFYKVTIIYTLGIMG